MSNGDAANRRAHVRTKTLRGATAIFNNGWCLLKCNVMDLSEGGARLRLHDLSIHCPDEFDLRIMATGEVRSCTVMWRRDRDVGVRWTD